MQEHHNLSHRITLNTVALYARLLLSLLIGLYTSRVVLDALGIDDFGIYNLVGGIILVVNFLTNALTLSIDRFLAYALAHSDRKRLQAVFSTAIHVVAITALLIFIFGEIIGLWFIDHHLVIAPDKLPAAHIVFHTSIISFVLLILSTPYNSAVIAHEHMRFFALTGILQSVFKLLIALALPLFTGSLLIVYAWLMVIPSALHLILNYIYSRNNFQETAYRPIADRPLLREMTTFAGYSLFGNMATALVTQGQSVLLNLFFGPSLNAVRGLSMQIYNALITFISGIYTAVNPQITKSYARSDHDFFRQLVFNSTKLAYALLFVLALPIGLEADTLLAIWLKEVPAYTVVFVRWMVVNALVYNFVTPSWMALQATGRVARIHLVTGSLNLLNLVITFLWWHFHESVPQSMLVINVLISLSMQTTTVIIQRQQLHIGIREYLSKVVGPMAAASCVAFLLPAGLHFSLASPMLRLFTVIPLAIVCSFLSFYYLGIGGELRQYIRQKAVTIIQSKSFFNH